MSDETRYKVRKGLLLLALVLFLMMLYTLAFPDPVSAAPLLSVALFGWGKVQVARPDQQELGIDAVVDMGNGIFITHQSQRSWPSHDKCQKLLPSGRQPARVRTVLEIEDL